jgi:hypothetical protein
VEVAVWVGVSATLDVKVSVGGITVGAARLGIWHARMANMMKSGNSFDFMLRDPIQASYHWQ